MVVVSRLPSWSRGPEPSTEIITACHIQAHTHATGWWRFVDDSVDSVGVVHTNRTFSFRNLCEHRKCVDIVFWVWIIKHEYEPRCRPCDSMDKLMTGSHGYSGCRSGLSRLTGLLLVWQDPPPRSAARPGSWRKKNRKQLPFCFPASRRLTTNTPQVGEHRSTCFCFLCKIWCFNVNGKRKAKSGFILQH